MNGPTTLSSTSNSLRTLFGLVFSPKKPGSSTQNPALRFILYVLKNTKKYSIPFTGLILFLYWRWRQSKRVTLFYNPTEANSSIIKSLSARLDSYSPTFWLPGPMIKTIYLGDAEVPNLSMYLREEVTMVDGEKVALDLFPTNFHEFGKDKPILLVMPGIVGT